MKQKLLNKLWLRVGMIVAVMTTALSGTAWAAVSYETVATFSSADVVNNSAYRAYSNDYWSLTWGGNNVSMGTNKNNASNCRISTNYGTEASISNVATAAVSKNKINNISQITFIHTAGSGNSGSIYFAYSTDGSTWNAITLTSGTQGASTPAANTKMTVQFNEISSAYFAVILDKGDATAANFRYDNVTITFDKALAGLTDSDFALTGDPVELTFDLYNATPQTVSFTTSSTGAVTVSESEYVTTSVNGNTITVTPVKETPSAQTITVSQAADVTYAAGEATFTVSVENSTPQYNVTYKANEGTGDDVVATYYQGADVTVAACSFTRSGYAFTKWNTQADGNGTDYSPNATISSISANIDFYAQWEVSNEVVDVIDHDFVGVSSYSNWSGKTGTSGAVYAGNSAGGDTNSGDCVQIRSNNSNSGIVTTTSGGLAKKVAVTWNSATADGRTLQVYGNSSAYSDATDLYNNSTQGTLIGTIIKGTGNSTELTITDEYEFVGLRSASGAMYLDAIRITWEPSSSSVVATPVISGIENFLTSTEVTITCATDGATIQYSIDGGSTWTDYNAPFALTATTTVKAKATMSGMDDSAEASMTFTKITPMTVAEARAAIDANNTVSNAYVSGVVFQVDSYNSTYHSITYWISDDGTNSNPLEVYSGKGLSGANFSSVDDIQIGDVVVVKGNLKKHNDDYEFDYNNELVSITTKTDPGLAYATTEYTVNLGETFTAPTLTNPNSLTVTYSVSDNDNVASVNTSTGAVTVGTNAGVVTITATFAGDATYRAGSASYTLRVIDPSAPDGSIDNPYTVADVEGQAEATTFGNDIYVTGYIVGCVKDNKCYKTTNDKLVDTNLLLADTPDVSYTEGASVASNTDGLIPVELPSSPSSIRTNWGVASNNVIGYKVILKGNAQAYFGTKAIKGTSEISAVSVPAKFNTSGYATFASTYPLDFSDDSEFSAWQITAANKTSGVLTFTQITGTVAAETGVLLKGTASETVSIPVAASGSDISSTNLLEAVTTATGVTAGQYYGLKGDQFVPVNAGTVPAGKALLPVAAATGVKAFVFDFGDDDPTGLERVQEVQEVQGAIYNLAGQRISKMQKGINIVNGKKVLK